MDTIDNQTNLENTPTIELAKPAPRARPSRARKSAAQSKAATNADPVGADPTLGAVAEDNRDLYDYDDEFDESILPRLPEDLIPGFHIFWGTTTNRYDTIEMRLRQGYTIVRPDEIRNYGKYHFNKSVSSGSISDGAICVNELVLLKLPQAVYNKRMARDHHLKPLAEQRGLVDRMIGIADKIGVNQTQTPLEEGMLAMAEDAKRASATPTFSQ